MTKASVNQRGVEEDEEEGREEEGREGEGREEEGGEEEGGEEEGGEEEGGEEEGGEEKGGEEGGEEGESSKVSVEADSHSRQPLIEDSWEGITCKKQGYEGGIPSKLSLFLYSSVSYISIWLLTEL